MPLSSIEPLESRIAPAALATLHLSADLHTATYTDVDGDHVTVKVTGFAAGKGHFAAADFDGVAGASGDLLQHLDLSGAEFPGANLTFSVVKAAKGDGLVNVGAITTSDSDLGTLSLPGDLGRLAAGDPDAATPALKALSVRSFGRFGVDTQGAGGSLESDVKGGIGKLTVRGDMLAYLKFVTGGGLGAVSIGGSLVGGAPDHSGSIQAIGDIGAVKIGHDIRGGTGQDSGEITNSMGKLTSVTVGGSVIGGSGNDSGLVRTLNDMLSVKIGHNLIGGTGSSSGFIHANKLTSIAIGGSLIGGTMASAGEIDANELGAVAIRHDVRGSSGADSGNVFGFTKIGSVTIGGSVIGGGAISAEIISNGDIGPVKIGHDLIGGTAGDSGGISAKGKLGNVTIGGSLFGGNGSLTGAITATGDIGAVKIGHDFTGGSITGVASLDSSGIVESTGGGIASVTIGGSIISGTDTGAGTLTNNATIRADGFIGALSVGHSIIGNRNAMGASPVVITARQHQTLSALDNLVIGKITVGGRVEYANIIGGADVNTVVVNGSARIGTVSVKGDWIASNLVAGAKPGANGQFGDGDDGAVDPAGVSRIASIVIGGTVFGTPAAISGTDHFGFVSQEIGFFKAGGITATHLTAASTPIELSLPTADVTVRGV